MFNNIIFYRHVDKGGGKMIKAPMLAGFIILIAASIFLMFTPAPDMFKIVAVLDCAVAAVFLFPDKQYGGLFSFFLPIIVFAAGFVLITVAWLLIAV